MLNRKRGRCLVAMVFTAVCLLGYFLLRLYGSREISALDRQILFTVRSKDQSVKIHSWHNYYDGKEYLFLPSFCDPQETKMEVSAGFFSDWMGEKLWDGAKAGLFSSFSNVEEGDHTLTVAGTDYKVSILYSSGVNSLFLTTGSGSLEYIEAEKGNGEAGTYFLYSAEGEEIAKGQMDELKSRGNVTFLEDKKPYQISLKDSADLLGTGKLDHYILLANRQDQSLLRDRILYDLSAAIGLACSPASRPVDLYINQEYRGSYLLSEKAEVAKNRLDIDTDNRLARPGFLAALEYGRRIGTEVTDPVFYTENQQAVIVKRPKDPGEKQMNYIASVFQQAESAIRKGTLEGSGIDPDSFARKYLIEEFGKNLDAMYSSQYFYRDAVKTAEDEKNLLYAGPVWDYDKTLGNPLIENTRPVNFQEARGIYAASFQEDASWWYDLYQVPEFKERFKRIYQSDMLPAIEEILDRKLEEYREEIWDSARLDYYRWDPFEDFKYETSLSFEENYQAQIQGIREFITNRAQFLKDIWLDGRAYDVLSCDPDGGSMAVTTIDAVEGRVLIDPRHPKREGYQFDHWIRTDTGETWDFETLYDGKPFTLKAVYVKKEE